MMRQLALALAAAVFALLSPGSALANESGVLRVLFGGDTAHAGSYHEQCFEISADEIGAHLALLGIEVRPAPAQSSATADQPRGN